LFKQLTPENEVRFDLYHRTINQSESEFSILLGRSPNSNLILNPGKVLHLCLKTLLKDLYQPISMGFLFSELFPNEYFNPTTSSRRVIQTVYRLNSWFKQNKVPLSVVGKNGQFKITASASFTISLETKMRNKNLDFTSVVSPQLLHLKNCYVDRSFTSTMAALELGLGKRQTQVLLSRWVQEKKLSSQKKGPHPGKNQRYTLPKVKNINSYRR
jgi:hypothetical protein